MRYFWVKMQETDAEWRPAATDDDKEYFLLLGENGSMSRRYIHEIGPEIIYDQNMA